MNNLLYSSLLSYQANEQTNQQLWGTKPLKNTTISIFSYYDSCMLRCNQDYIIQQYQQYNRTNHLCYTNQSIIESLHVFPYYLSPSSLSEPSSVCGLPSPCISVLPNTMVYSMPETQTLPLNNSLSSLLETIHIQELINNYKYYIDVLISEALKPAGAISINTPLALRVLTWDKDTGYSLSTSNLVKSRSLIRKLPGFLFSSYAPTANRSPLLIRINDYYTLLKYTEQDYQKIRSYTQTSSSTSLSSSSSSITDTIYNETLHKYRIPKYRLLIKLYKNITNNQKDMLINILRSTIGNDMITVQDTASVLNGAKFAIDGLDIFFLLCSGICLYLCFFGTWLSFTANIRYSMIEIGIIRSLGLPSYLTTRIYIYEALAVTLSACINGLTIGLLTAIALSLQFNLFVEMPFQLILPLPLIILFLISSSGIAIYASYYPAQPYSKGTIAAVVKGKL